MARKPRTLIEGGLYHVTSRGNDRQTIFRDDHDRERFVERLAESVETYQVRLFLFCLMPNHFHLLAETPLGNLDRFMSSLLTGYTVYFNRRHRRVGHLMQGRYGAQVVEQDEHLLKLSRYIHLNPVQIQKMREMPLNDRLSLLKTFPWSSYRAYTGQVKPGDWLTTGPVLAMLEAPRKVGQPRAYARYVEAGIAKSDEEFVRLMSSKGIAIGSEGFIERIQKLAARTAEETLKREDVSFCQIRMRKSVAEVEAAVRHAVGGQWGQRNQYKAGRLVRGLIAWALQKYAGMTQRQIADYLGVGTGSAVSYMISHAFASTETKPWRAAVDSRFKG